MIELDPELVELARGGVTMTTTIEADRVCYAVWVGRNVTAGDRSDARRVWQEVVSFGAARAYRAGGRAFQGAARAQERVAQTYVAAAQEARAWP